MKMNKFAIKAALTIIILYGGLIIFRFLTIPYSIDVTPNFENESDEYVLPETYRESIKKDKAAGLTFAENYSSAYYFNLHFPFDRHEIDKEESNELVELLTDSSNYLWGETTSEYFGSIVFYDSINRPIALINLDDEGYNKVYPSLSLMKWGTMRKHVNERIKEIIH